MQVLGLQQTGIGRRQVPGIEPDDIPGDQLCDRQLQFVSITQNRGSCSNLLPNILHRMSSLKLHVEVHDHAEQDDGDDDRAADRIAQRDRDGAGRQENEDQGIGKKAEKTDQSGEARLPYQAVRAMETQSLFRLGGSQSGRSCFEQLEQVPQGHIPEAVQRLVRLAHAWNPFVRPSRFQHG